MGIRKRIPRKKTKVAILMALDCCNKCPNVIENRTPDAGYAFDYFCSAKDNKKIMGYVEYDSELAEVPNWCPYRVD